MASVSEFTVLFFVDVVPSVNLLRLLPSAIIQWAVEVVYSLLLALDQADFNKQEPAQSRYQAPTL